MIYLIDDNNVLFTKERLSQLVKHIKSKYHIPKWDITTEPIEEDDIFISKFGGFPYWSFDMEYPIGENGQPLYLLAQLVLGGKEMLQFFIADDDMYGLNCNNQTDATNFRVIYHEYIDRSVTIESLRKRGIPSSAEAVAKAEMEGSEILLPMSSKIGKIYFTRGLDYLSPTMHKHVDIVKAEIALLFHVKINELDDNINEVLWDVFESDGSKLYGLPFFTQEDPRDDDGNYNGKKYEILLFQVDSMREINLMWGDNGICNFFINAEDLANHDFSNVLYNWDCY